MVLVQPTRSSNVKNINWFLFMRATESAYKDKLWGWVGFNVPVSHRIDKSLLVIKRWEDSTKKKQF